MVFRELQEDILKYIRDNPGDINEYYNCSGDTRFCPIHLAIAIADIGFLEEIGQYEPDYNKKDRLGQTPIQHALAFGNVKIISYLLEQNIDLNTDNSLKEDICDKIVTSNNPEIEKLFQKYYNEEEEFIDLLESKKEKLQSSSVQAAKKQRLMPEEEQEISYDYF